MSTVRDVLGVKGREVVTIRPDATVRDAVVQLVSHGIGCLVASDSAGEVAGILTERDILKIVREDAERLGEIRVEERMTTDVLCGVPEDELDYVMAVMTERHFRHMPIIEEKKLAGILSIGDVVKALKSQREYEVRQLKEYISGGYA